jgi:hypothetical protein
VEGMMMVRSAAIFFFLICGIAAAQSNEWPAVLAVPVKPDSTVDSSQLRVSSGAKVFENTQNTNSSVNWGHEFRSWQLRQNCDVVTSNDISVNRQASDFSGSLIRDSVLPKNGSFGLEWSPVMNLSRRTSGGEFYSTNDFGPVMQWNLHELPVRLRGGISASDWNADFPAHLSDLKYDDFHSNVGFYGAFSAGDPMVRLFGQPVYVTTEAFVRAVKMVGIAAINGSALFAHSFGGGDSLFAYYGDSLSNGRERLWGGGQQQYINTPWRIARSLQASGGIKFKERHGIQPAAVYSFRDNSVAYPTLPGVPMDRRTRFQSLNLLAEVKGKIPAVYKGGIRILWGREEWLFKSDLASIADTFRMGPARKDTLTRDSLSIKLNDHQIYRAATDHMIDVTLPRGMSMKYTFSIFRDSKTYDFTYSDSSVRKYDDDDIITMNHHLDFIFPQFRGLNVDAFGDYSVRTENYIKKVRSAANKTKNGYWLGLNVTYRPSERFMLSERIAADAEMDDYFYKKSHLNDPPSYNRRFSSMCTGLWKINDCWELSGRWDENYNDEGVWNGHEYFDSARASSLGTDYYAVVNKVTIYSVELGLAMVRKMFRIESGCRLEDNYIRNFVDSTRTYGTQSGGIGYKLEPFVDFRMSFHRFSIRSRVARLINTLAPDKAVFRKNWDINIAGQAVW